MDNIETDLEDLDSLTSNENENQGFIQCFISQDVIIYIQYCLLRMPFFLLYDYLLTDQFSSIAYNFLNYSIEIMDHSNNFFLKPFTYILKHNPFQFLLNTNILILMPILCLVILVALLLCSDQHLVIFYSYTISILVIYFYYQMNRLTNYETNVFLLQVLLSTIYIQMLNLRSYVPIHSIQTRICYIAPIFCFVVNFLLPLKHSVFILRTYCFVWLIIHLFELFIFQRNAIINTIRNQFLNELIMYYEIGGISEAFNYVQQNIPFVTLLKIFWLTKIIVAPLSVRTILTNPYMINSTMTHNSAIAHDAVNNTNMNYTETLTKTIYFTVLFYGTETIFTLISLSCLVSNGIKYIARRLFRWLHLWTEDVEQIGTVIGFMFFLLLFQSNLTQLELNRRHIPLLKALSLLIIALFHFLHTILEPQLLKVAMQTMTTQMAFVEDNQQTLNNNQKRSIDFYKKLLRSFVHRHVYTCLTILFILIIYISILWRVTKFSTWLLAITAFSIELIVRLTASLAQYAVYVLDAHGCLPTADSLEEYIFRIKAVTSSIEFVLGVFLLFNGAYILIYEARGALRAFMLATHAYLNIIKTLRRGWRILRNRKSAWDNVNQLPLATQEQIENYNDICSICHNNLTVGSTCVAPCSHLFHRKCLQKVFYTTQNCALCSRPIIIEPQR